MSPVAGSRKRRGAPRRRMPAADRRALILEAARAAFAEGGYHGTSLEDVADRAGVSKALLYEHFSSKRELHAAMLEMHALGLVEALAGALAAADPGEDRMRAGLEAFFGYVEERRGVWRILFRGAGDPDVAGWLARIRDEVAAAIAALMAEEVEAASLPDPLTPVAVEMAAQQLVGAMQSLADWWDQHAEVPREVVVKVAMEFAWLGLDRVRQGERWRAQPGAG